MAGAKRNDVRYLDLSKNRINADHLVDDPKLQEKIAHIHRLFPHTKKDAIAKILLCCDNNIDSAVTKLSSGESVKEALDEWEVAKGKGWGKTGTNSSKKTKKGSVQALNGNGASAEVPPLVLSNGVCESDGEEGGKMNGHHNGAPSRSVSTSPIAEVSRTRATQSATDTQPKSSSTLQAPPLPQRTWKRRGRQPVGTSTQPSGSRVERVNGPSRTSSTKQQDASTTRPAEATPTVTQPVQMQEESSLQKEIVKKQEEPPPPKPVDSSAVSSVQVDRSRLDSTASTGSTGGGGGGDSVKRLLKDITRCHVSLARHQTNLQERCDVSARLIHQTFAQLRTAVNEREECLVEQLERVRSSAGKMLEERQETSAHLKVLGERLLNQSREHDITHVRAQMKAFVSDRKIDEEIGSVSRFQADPDQLVQQISTFGKINSISHTYTAWCAGQVVVSPAMITSVSTGPIPPSSSAITTTSPAAETDPVGVAQLAEKDDGRKKMEQEKATKSASVNKLQQQPHANRKEPTQPSPLEQCTPDELLARQERVKASLLAQGVILYPPAGELAPSKKSGKRDRKRRNAQRAQDSGPGEESGAKETAVNPPNAKSQASTNGKPPPSVSRPQAGAKLESASTASVPAEKTNERKRGGPASGQGSKVLPPTRDSQKATSAPQSRPKGTHYEQSVIIVHSKSRGRGQRSWQQTQQPRPAPDSNRGGQGRQQREDRKRAVKPSKQQTAPVTNGSEVGSSVVEKTQKQEDAAIPEKKESDPGSKPKTGSAALPGSPLVGQTAPEHADLPGEEGEAAVEIQSEEMAFMDTSTSSAEPGSEEQQKLTRKQSLRVTPSPDHSEAPHYEEEEPEESFQLKSDLTPEPQTGVE